MASKIPSTLPPWAKQRHDPDPPDGWQEMPLIAVADIRFSNVDKKSYLSEKPVRLCNYTDVYNKEYVYGHEDFMHATASEGEISRFAVAAGDVIITKDSETPDDIGVPAVVLAAPKDLLCGYHLALIRPRSDAVDPVFLAKQIAHPRISRYYARLANGLTRYGLTNAVVEFTPVWLPEPEEQRRAAHILREIDEAILKTERLIAKLKAIKQGLLHDLLTRGLDDNGELRDPERCPEQFKETPLGVRPKDWTLCALADIATLRIEKTVGAKDGSKPYVGLEHIASCDPVLLGTAGAASSVSINSVFYRGDVLFGKLRPNLRKSLLAPFDGYCSTDILVLQPNAGFDVRFVSRVFQLEEVFDEAVRTAEGTKMPRTSWARLKGFSVFVPDDDSERAAIADILDAAEARSKAEEAYLSKLKAIKKGLMQDLLTGRVRVPADKVPAFATG